MQNEEFILGDNEFKLPVGYIDEEGVLHNTVKLKPMTGRTEEAMDKPDVKKNGAKVFTELIKGIIVELGSLNFAEKGDKLQRNIINDLPIVDRDAILLYNSFVSFDLDEKSLEFEADCSKCGEKNDVQVDLTELDINPLENPKQREFSFELIDGYYDSKGKVHKKVVIKLPTGRLQMSTFPYFQQKKVAEGMTMSILNMLEKLGETSITRDTVIDLTTRDRKLIYRYIPQTLNLGVDFGVKYNCAYCGAENETSVPLGKLLDGGLPTLEK